MAKFEIDERILAKLMVLEYIDLARFEELCDWQQIQNGKPKQMTELETIAQNPKERPNAELTEWNKDIIHKCVKMQPSLKDVNLMDYFWIARDKLDNTIDAEAMVSQIVRLVYKSITTYTTKASLKSEIIKIGQLSGDERARLLNMIRQNMLEHPEDERYFEIAHAIINEGYSDMMVVYKEVLQTLADNNKILAIPPSIAFGMKELGKKDIEIVTLVKTFDKNSRVYKFLHKKNI